MSFLYLITARGGSKGLPGKNIKLLGGKPLIEYSIETARKFSSDKNICLSTDDDEIIKVANGVGLTVPFKRPPELASDTSGTREVILHALDFYEQKGLSYDAVVLLQPTSPFRNEKHILEMKDLFSLSLDMVVSVRESHDNPYFTLFEEDDTGYLKPSKPGNYMRRQDCPKVYCYNGSVYIMNTKSVRETNPRYFPKIKKYVMSEVYSIDIDNQFDWQIAEMILEKKLLLSK